MELEKIELEKKYGHLGYNKDIDNSGNLYNIALKRYANSVRNDLLEEIINEVELNNGDDNNVKSIIINKYIECMNNKKDFEVIENVLIKKIIK